MLGPLHEGIKVAIKSAVQTKQLWTLSPPPGRLDNQLGKRNGVHEPSRIEIEPKWLEPKWLEPKWLRIIIIIIIINIIIIIIMIIIIIIPIE